MLNNNWKEALKRVSLMGLKATEITPELKKFFQEQHIKGEQSQQILAGISLLSLQERGHFTFKKTSIKKSTPFPKAQKLISPYQNGLLSQILNKEYKWALFELITIIKAHHLLIPAFRIPDLINYGLSEPWLKPWIEELTGVQGAWALSHIPRWEKRYSQIQSGHWQLPKALEKKIFPLLNLKNPLPNLTHILPFLDFPAKIWSEKFSKRVHDYIHVCMKLPNIDINTQDDLEDLIHFASYLTNVSNPIFWAEDDHGKIWVAALVKYNQVLKFRAQLNNTSDLL